MTAKPRPIPAPRLPDHDTPDALPGDRFEDLESYRDLHLEDFRASHANGVTLQQVRIRRGDFNSVQLVRLDLNDVVIEGGDLSNGDWDQASGRRVVLQDCRITGLKLNRVRFQEAAFRNCQGKYMQFERSVFKQVRFEHCALIEASFDGADLSGAVFVDCDLFGASFSGAKLVGADFRGSRLESSRAKLSELRGAIISPSQAAALLEHHVGVLIRPEED